MIEILAILIAGLFDQESDRDRESKRFWKGIKRQIKERSGERGGMEMAVPLYEGMEECTFPDEWGELIDVALFYRNSTAVWLADGVQLNAEEKETMLQVSREFGILKL